MSTSWFTSIQYEHEPAQLPQVDQYDHFKVQGHTYTIEPTSPLSPRPFNRGEDISDNGGVAAAYVALQDLWTREERECVPGTMFTANQLFWVRQQWGIIGHI